MFGTKRHAVNYARVTIDAGRDKPAAKPEPKPEPVAKPEPKPAAAAPAKPAPRRSGRRVNWRSPDAPWRKQPQTGKQRRMVGHLGRKLRENGLPATDANCDGMNRGETSDLIDELKSRLRAAAGQPETGGCDIGPFRGGYCTVCGLVEK